VVPECNVKINGGHQMGWQVDAVIAHVERYVP
jgi:hypothetical protein